MSTLPSSSEATPLSSWELLIRDRHYRAIVALTFALSIPFIVPLLDADALEVWTIDYYDLLALALIVIGLGYGRSRISDPGERRFWRLLQLSIGVLWAIRALETFVLYRWVWAGAEPFTDIAYLAFYAMVLFAAGMAPHRRAGRGSRDSRRAERLAILVALGALLTYFALIPARMKPEVYETLIPSLYLFVVLDLLVIWSFVRLRHEVRDGPWSGMYLALACAAVLWAIGDTLELLELNGRVDLGIGTPAEILWALPGLVLLGAARIRYRSAEPGLGEGAPRAPRRLPDRFALTALLFLPIVHLVLYRSGLADPDMGSARDVTILGAMLILGLMARVQRRRIQRDRIAAREERDRQEERVRESEARYRALVEHAPDAIVILDPESRCFVDANSSAVELFGMTRDELLEVGFREVSPGRQPDGRSSSEVIAELVRSVMTGRPEQLQWVHLGSEGREIHCDLRLSRMPTAAGPRVRASIVDVTEKRLLKAELLQAQKMESIGRLAGGVAHDFNNLLTVINGYAHEALGRTDLPDELAGPLLEIASAGDRAGKLTRQLLTFSRKHASETEIFNVDRALTKMGQMLRRLIGENIRLTTSPCVEPCYVRVDRGQLEQAIVNLAVNARDAMPEGGRLHLSTALVQEEVGTGEGDTPEFVEIRVTDSGAGMDAETQARVFEPFYTTKDLGKGTGLGLSTVFGFASQSGGAVEVTSKPDCGATFRLRLPRYKGPLPEVTDGREGLATPDGSGTILLVEDERPVRDLIRRVLETRGYHVVASASIAEALEERTRLDRPIDLLVTDMVLTEGTGLDLARNLRRELPTLQVLLISGYTAEALGPEVLETENIAYLAKPFTPDGLMLQVRGALTGGPGAVQAV